jgi:hypothetical protein
LWFFRLKPCKTTFSAEGGQVALVSRKLEVSKQLYYINIRSILNKILYYGGDMKAKYFIIIAFLFFSCGNNNFNIKLSRAEEYEKIYNLIKEIYKNAKENNVEYFKNAVGKIIIREFETEDEKTEWCNFLRRINKRENYTNDEIINYEIPESVQKAAS